MRRGYIRKMYCCPLFKNNTDTSISTKLMKLQELFTNLPANYTFGRSHNLQNREGRTRAINSLAAPPICSFYRMLKCHFHGPLGKIHTSDHHRAHLPPGVLMLLQRLVPCAISDLGYKFQKEQTAA